MLLPVVAQLAVPNGSDGTLYLMPANYQGFISNFFVYNPTGGSLNVTIKKLASNGTLYTLGVVAIATTVTTSFANPAGLKLVPMNLLTNESLILQGSGAGLIAHASGLRWPI